MSDMHHIDITVNGRAYKRTVAARTTLADFLRHDLRLTGTHLGCEHGVCGACTVLIDGRSARSCLTFAARMDGRSLTTVEGLSAPDGTLGALQRAFQENHGLQCGYCTPGMLMSLTELLADNPDPSEKDVRLVLTGHLCRCTGYTGAVEATLAVARATRAREAA